MLDLVILFFGVILATLLVALLLSSLQEKKTRAAMLALTSLLLFSFIWFGGLYLFPVSRVLYISVMFLIFTFTVLFFAPLGRIKPLRIEPNSERVDERDTVFARDEYAEGTEKHETYYELYPERQETDNKTRRMGSLLAPGSTHYNEKRSGEIRSIFREISEMTTKVDGAVAPEQVSIDPKKITPEIKETCLTRGASAVGVGPLNPRFVYSHVGRGPETWGSPIENHHPYAIIFTLEMDYFNVEGAPTETIIEESAKNYLKGAKISIALAEEIRKMGYSARAHISDSNYQIMLPAVAVDAGLGELGRMGYLISPKLGPRIRLGAVTTDLPLITDKPTCFGVQEFCKVCKKCAENCPPNAIPMGEKHEARGAWKWSLSSEKCFRYWKTLGTDCGLCMKHCPYSHPPTWIHNLVRIGIRRSSFARRVSVLGENLLYGRRHKAY